MRRTLSGLLLLLTLVPLAFAEKPVGPQFEQEPFGMLPEVADKKGKKSQQIVTAYTLINRNGAKAKIIDYGGIVTELHMPDKNGKMADVVLGFDSLKGYLDGHPYFGSNVGRCANRIANAKFSLDGKSYSVSFPGDGPHTLHGGKTGFDKKLWRSEPFMSVNGPGVKLAYTSPNGEEGYPGTLSVLASITLTNDNALKVEYTATTDKPTICNLAHHSYFNLGGHNSGDILGHEVQLMAKNYTPADDTLIPTGKIAPVAETPFDFTKPTTFGKRIQDVGGKPVGYDLNYVLDGKAGSEPFLAARVTDAKSGRVMELFTTEPGLQVYTGNFLDGTNKGKGGAVYQQYNGFCMEPQRFPDSINKPEWKETSNVILRPGEEYRQTTIYKFSVQK